MENDIINMIAEAEREAAEQKSQAAERAAEIVAAAEKRAAEISKSSEEEIRILGAEMLLAAENRATAEYERALAESRESAAAYAGEILAHADAHVFDIVGRLTK